MAQPMSDDRIEQLRERIRSTAAAADRLAADFAGAAEGAGGAGGAGAGGAGGAGWTQAAGGGWAGPDSDEATHELQALVNLVHLLRDLLPPELRQQVLDLLRTVLLLLRAIIDRFVAGLDPTAPAPGPVVEDIPVD